MGRQGRPFPTYILENLKNYFIPTAVLIKLWQLILLFLFSPCFNGLWIRDRTGSIGQRGKTSAPKDLSQGSLQSSSHTKLAPHSYHAKIIAVIIWITIWLVFIA